MVPGIGAVNVFCDMTTDDGGWTMVAYFKNPSNYVDIFYASNNSAYGAGAPDPDSATAWSDWRVLANVDWPIEMAVVIDTYGSWESSPAKVIYQVKSRAVMPSYGEIHDLTSGDNLYYKFTFSQNWIDVGSSSISPINYWSPLSSTNQYLTLLYSEDNRTTFYGSGIPHGYDTWYHSSWWLVR
jgi:hypothetical protein